MRCSGCRPAPRPLSLALLAVDRGRDGLALGDPPEGYAAQPSRRGPRCGSTWSAPSSARSCQPDSERTPCERYTLSQRTSQATRLSPPSPSIGSLACCRSSSCLSSAHCRRAAGWQHDKAASWSPRRSDRQQRDACSGPIARSRAALPTALHTSAPGTRALRLADALARYRGHRTALACVFAPSVAVQILRIVQAWLLGRGIGIDVPFSYYLFFMPIGLVALMLPISISGFGVPQAVIVWLLRPRGVPEPDALALSTLIVLTGHHRQPAGRLALSAAASPPSRRPAHDPRPDHASPPDAGISEH